MNREELLAKLNNHVPADEFEWTMWVNTIAFVEKNPHCFERSLAIGHVTASGWVVSPDRQHVLLMHHRKLNRWFQPGGHCDGDPNVLGVAMKEVREETGIRATPVGGTIFDVDVHLIPATSREAAHYHYDIRFQLEADPNHKVEYNHEAREVRWVPMEEVILYNSSESILRMVRKTSPNV
jgi:8-oxo-dGTP pyrophosphatase MutT (NUDIX family)